MRTRIGWAMAAALVLSACGSQDQKTINDAAQKIAQGAQQSQQGTPQQAQQGAATLSQGLQQMAQGLQQAAQRGADGKAITPVDFDQLISLLPTVDGWDRDKPQGQTVTTPIANSNASANYTKGNFRVKVEITDSAFSPMLLGPLTMLAGMGINERSSSGYKKSSTVNGQLVYEELNSDNKHAEITNVINKRFIVVTTGDGMDTMDPAKEISSRIDLNKLASLK